MSTLWLTISADRNHFEVQQRDALPVSNSADPQCFISVIGGRRKSQVLQQLVEGFREQPRHGQVHLFKDSSRPSMYYMDCEAHVREQRLEITKSESGLYNAFHLAWPRFENMPYRSVVNLFYAQVLTPLSSVVCYFAGDLGGLRGVAKMFAEQVLHPLTTDIPHTALPQLLVITETTSPVFDETKAKMSLLYAIDEVLQVNEPDQNTRSIVLQRLRDSAQVIGFHSATSLAERARRFRSTVTVLSEIFTMFRQAAGLSFSSKHLRSFSTSLIEHFTTGEADAFSFVRSSRPSGFDNTRFEAILTRFLRAWDAHLWQAAVVPLVAGALLLSSYPPGSHFFPPTMIFRQLWHQPCLDAIRACSEDEYVQEKFIYGLEQEMQRQFNATTSQRLTTSMHYTQNLAAINEANPLPKTRLYCTCLVRMPERDLSCGHAFCEICLQIVGVRGTRPNTYILANCPICDEVQTANEFKRKPAETGVRILSLDGGGIRGLAELMVLARLESDLSFLKCPLRDFFDLMVGSSAGGIIALGIGSKEWEAVKCLDIFQHLALRLFPKAKPSSLSFLRDLFRVYLHDSRSDPNLVDAAFQDTFDNDSFFSTISSKIKVAVTTTRVHDAMPCVLSNYNGIGRHLSPTGYDLIRAGVSTEDITLADAAACTSAAPWFFKPRFILNNGFFEDGGLHSNCPKPTSLSEARILWPNMGEHPDFCLSLGTGFSARQSSMTPRFLTRLIKNFKQSLDGETISQRHMNTLHSDAKRRYHRLNPFFDFGEPRLDDTNAIPILKEAMEITLRSPEWTKKYRLAIDSMLASIFYFVLDEQPVYTNGQYYASGQIFCQLDLPPEGFENLSRFLLETRAFFLVNGTPFPCVDKNLKARLPFRKHVSIWCRSRNDVVAISICGATSRTCMISDMPKTLKTCEERQKLDAPFGTIEHFKPEKPLPLVPQKRKIGRDNGDTRRVTRRNLRS